MSIIRKVMEHIFIVYFFDMVLYKFGKPMIVSLTREKLRNPYITQIKWMKVARELFFDRLHDDFPTLKFSNSCFSRSWRWRAWFSSDIFSLLDRICDCTRARVCIQRKVLAAWRLIELPSTSAFNRTRPRRALSALLACITNEREV